MLDFYKIISLKRGTGDKAYYEVRPDFIVGKPTDLMVTGRNFYAIWNPETELWSTDESIVPSIVDREILKEKERLEKQHQIPVKAKLLRWDSSGMWIRYKNYLTKLPDNRRQLDKRIAFENTEVKKEDYISKRLPYRMEEGTIEAFNTLFGILYNEEELRKIKWVIGSIISGDSTVIQKFYVLYGRPGTGKSTVLNLFEKLFSDYTVSFEARELTKANSSFALEMFKDNPLVAIDHEGDLSRIRNNSLLNSVVSHDRLPINAKYASLYSLRLNTTLLIASNKRVLISNAKDGITRRLIDIEPTGIRVPPRDYETLVKAIDFELGAIAHECLNLYSQLGINAYADYNPQKMIEATDHLFNFVKEYSFEFKHENMKTLTELWTMYKMYCEEIGIKYFLNRTELKDQMSDYWEEFHDRKMVDGKHSRSLFVGFRSNVFDMRYMEVMGSDDPYDWLELGDETSIFDRVMVDQPAQLALKSGKPGKPWLEVETKLSDIDTSKLHYILPKSNMIMVDFDLKDEEGNKSLKLNLEAVRSNGFKHTYAEVSKSGSALHLYYYYDGDVTMLEREFSPGIEIIRPVGLTSFRRKLTLCNQHEISTINSGLPLIKHKGEVMVSAKRFANEQSIRRLLAQNLMKKIHPNTKPSVDFIHKILAEAYASGMRYDVFDMRPAIFMFASESTNHGEYCTQLVMEMKFKSDHTEDEMSEDDVSYSEDDDSIIFYDVEVYPNLLMISWKVHNVDGVMTTINPTRKEVEELMEHRLIGFNNRHYDNHILYAARLGYDLEQIYSVSSRIVNGTKEESRAAQFSAAWGISYADTKMYVEDKFKSLKWWQVHLGLPHDEIDIPWDEPVSEEYWPRIQEYCENDVITTEALHNHFIGRFQARKILAELSGLRVNDGDTKLVETFIFGNDKKPQTHFKIPDLSKEFPGYRFDKYAKKDKKSTYREEFVGEGGYVYSEPGIYDNVVYMDVSSMHPTSLIVMDYFGPYTKRYSDLKRARVLIKEGKLEEAGTMFDGALGKYMDDPSNSKALSDAMKLVLNSVYGKTFSDYEFRFNDKRNIDNVIAKRGALFMVDLKHALWERGCKPIHFKTDSVKIANYKPEDIEFVYDFARKYGYEFSIECVYDKLFLHDKATLIGKIRGSGEWESVGDRRFRESFVYKALFTGEPIVFEDLQITINVTGGAGLYLESDNGDLSFVGKVGKFTPMKTQGGLLYRIQGDKKGAPGGTKGYRWFPSEAVRTLGLEEDIDVSYFESIVDTCKSMIAEYGDVTEFLGE